MLYKCTHYYYFYNTRLTASFPTQKGKTTLDLNKARDDGVLGCSGISRTIRKQSAPRSRQITTPTPHNSFFTGRTLFLTPNQQHQSIEGKAAYRTHAKWWERDLCVTLWCVVDGVAAATTRHHVGETQSVTAGLWQWSADRRTAPAETAPGRSDDAKTPAYASDIHLQSVAEKCPPKFSANISPTTNNLKLNLTCL